MKLKVNCREVTHLLLHAEDKPLPWLDKLRIRLHMRICATCPRFARQVVLMRGAFAQLRRGSEE
jgi:hypothetical protein